MKIVILQGSPNIDGSTALLADSFAKGAKESGHEVKHFDLDRMEIHPCTGCVAWNADDWTFEALTAHYKTLVRYLNLDDRGMVLGYGCGTPGMTKRSKYMQEAYLLGKNL